MARHYLPQQLKKLLKQATKEQLAWARNSCIDYFNACHAAGVEVENPTRIVWEALTVALLDGEPETEGLSKREFLEARNYIDHYSGGYETYRL